MIDSGGGRCHTPGVERGELKTTRGTVYRCRSVLVAGTLIALLLAGCSSSSTPGTTSPKAADAAVTTCHRPLPARPVQAKPVPGVPSDWNVTSFDGTTIRAHWFPVHPGSAQQVPDRPHGPGLEPVRGHGHPGTPVSWARSRIKTLWAAGYNVLTWDPRGFGQSGGVAEVDSPAYEARDVSSLIDWVATRPGVELDAPGDPRMGMVGGSYGGGIQLVTAATDCRIDAIVPTIAWHSLVTSLGKADTFKSGWSNILANLSASDHVDPEVHEGQVSGNLTGMITAGRAASGSRPGARAPWWPASTSRHSSSRAPSTRCSPSRREWRTTRSSRKTGVPTAMLWFCGGHGVCLTPPGNQELPVTATIDWLNRYVKRDTSVNTGPRVPVRRPERHRLLGQRLPGPHRRSGDRRWAGDAGPGAPAADPGRPTPRAAHRQLAGLVGPITPAKAANAVNVAVSFGNRSAVVVGAPQLQLTYRGTTPPGTRPTRVFAQLVDESTGLVLGNQITPIDVTLDGQTHTTSVPLEMVAFTGKPGDHIELQLVATTVAYATPRLGGSVEFTHIHIALPGGVGHHSEVGPRRRHRAVRTRPAGLTADSPRRFLPLGWPPPRDCGRPTAEGPALAEQVPESGRG